jgi:hypothetical protein
MSKTTNEITEIPAVPPLTQDTIDSIVFAFRAGESKAKRNILEAVQAIEDRSNATRTPLFQDTLFELIREAVDRVVVDEPIRNS